MSLRVKSFFADSIAAAMAAAREELGPEAMILQSRRTPPENRHVGEYEVVFALRPPEALAVVPAVTQPDNSAHRELSAEVTALRQQMERMISLVMQGGLGKESQRWSQPECAEWYQRLVEQGVGPELAQQLVQTAEQQSQAEIASLAAPLRAALSKTGGGRRKWEQGLRNALMTAIEKQFPVDATLASGKSGRQVIALVGPPGVGKTTTLAKLAVRYGLAMGRPIQFLSLDGERIAAAEQLRAYAGILGASFQQIDTAAVLGQALDDYRQKEIVFIDTPGWGLGEMQMADELAKVLRSREDVTTHLVLSAAMKPRDLGRVAAAYEVFRPSRLLFTKLDQTDTFGNLLNEASRSGKPVSFFCHGQQVPEDLEPANSAYFAELLLGKEIASTQAAA